MEARTLSEIEAIHDGIRRYLEHKGVAPQGSGSITEDTIKKIFKVEKHMHHEHIIFDGGGHVVDHFGNPIILILSEDYANNSLALKKSQSEYFNENLFQVRSFGRNGKDDRGEGDDVQNIVIQK